MAEMGSLIRERCLLYLRSYVVSNEEGEEYTSRFKSSRSSLSNESTTPAITQSFDSPCMCSLNQEKYEESGRLIDWSVVRVIVGGDDTRKNLVVSMTTTRIALKTSSQRLPTPSKWDDRILRIIGKYSAIVIEKGTIGEWW